jgi:hypothetical protein
VVSDPAAAVDREHYHWGLYTSRHVKKFGFAYSRGDVLGLLLSAAAAILLTSAAFPVSEVFPASPLHDVALAVHAQIYEGEPSVLDAALSSEPASSTESAPGLGSVCYPTAFTYDAARNTEVFDPALLARMQGPALLSNAAMLSAGQLKTFVAEHPETVHDVIRTPPAGGQVTRWWNDLSSAQRRALKLGAPELVGNLEGVPVSARDVANRRYLAETKRAILDSLDRGVGRGVQRTLLRDLHMLGEIEAAVGDRDAMPGRSLLTLETKWPGRAAIAVGDLSTADYVTFVVPGMFYSVDAHMRDWTDATARMYDEQASFEGLFQEKGSVATVSWIGYQTPHLLNIGTLDLAREGANYLSNAIAGVRATRGTDPFISVVAHSYGSTAALLALSDGSTRADALALVGSPGSDAQSVHDLAVPAENVYVGEAGGDPVVDSAFFGSDPGAASFGAKKLSVAGSVDRLTQEVLNPSSGHNDYFTPGSEASRNLALVGIDKGRWVTDGSPDDAEKTLALAG